jgi:hypothetical protein
MESRLHLCPPGRGWKDFYMAAIFEDDDAKIPDRIVEAERALATRAAEMFDTGDRDNQGRERQAMENAVYFLQLLRKISGKMALSGEHSDNALHASSAVQASNNQNQWA